MVLKDRLTQEEINDGLISYITNSPTAFHASENIASELLENGYSELFESDKWNLNKGGKYFVKRNDSAIIAFKMTSGDIILDGVRMVGAHTDSPALKVKPNPENKFKNYLNLAVEPYGGLLLGTWFDRDLSLAGRITYLATDGKIKNTTIDFKAPIATIPSVAIHLDRKANDGKTFNKQKDLPPLFMQVKEGDERTYQSILLDQVKKEHKGLDIDKILDSEMFFYDFQAPRYVGFDSEYISASRLDNLLSCFVGVKSLLNAGNNVTSLLVCNDHEECGSDSTSGAGGSFLKDVLERITGCNREDYIRFISNSMLISADNAHAIHPNFPEKHDGNHGPLINEGPVVKINANQRYASNSETTALFTYLCQQENVPMQKFVARSDMGCGSTIGPITSTLLGVKTLDIGLPTFGMHSIRELVGNKDSFYLYKVLSSFFA